MKTLLNRALALSAAVACLIPPTAAAADRSSFLLGVLPDTQFYSRYSIPSSGELFMNRWGSEPSIEQTKWLVANKDDLEIPFVTHLRPAPTAGSAAWVRRASSTTRRRPTSG